MFEGVGEPLWMTMERRRIEREGGDISVVLTANKRTARTVMAMYIDGTTVQLIVLAMVVLDVMCVICELVLVGTKCGGECQECAEETYMCILDGLDTSAHGSDYINDSCEEDTVHRVLKFGMRVLGGNTTDENMNCAHGRLLGGGGGGAHASCSFLDHHDLSPTQVCFELYLFSARQ